MSSNGNPYRPIETEVLEVIKYLGYRKVAPVAEHIDRPPEQSTAPDESD